ncbi:hypothetical protein [Crateriforma conspicua]|uniref:Uncharacterized protein n=1 Tax=Crateriforma conspicua TaxID=2527996 RepID=A0A5C6FW14_9PLAN|nr:hypothetical protein [Crateriforma conspicua]TWU66546.1 hypothetical protein V7x_21130 [Crateriforma conspicua]
MTKYVNLSHARCVPQVLAIVILSLHGSVLVGQTRATNEVESVDERLVGNVYDGLAAFAVHRDAMLKRRRCLFIEGERYLVGKKHDPQVNPLYYIQISDRAKRFEYVANGFLNLPGTLGRDYQTQTWNEKVLCRGQVRFGGGPTNSNRLYSYGEKERKRDAAAGVVRVGKVFYIDPFEDLISLASELRSTSPTRGMMEDKFLRSSKLLSVEEQPGGKLLSRWRKGDENRGTLITLVMDATKEYLPVSTSHVSNEQKQLGVISRTLCEWKRVGTNFVPGRMEFQGKKFGRGDTFDEIHFLKLSWRFGKEVPQHWTDSEREDYLELVMDHYGKTYDRSNGKLPPFKGIIRADPWETPADLFISSPKNDARENNAGRRR